VTDHLRRNLAPVTDAAWTEIDEEAERTLRHFLAGRALVDFSGPKGWDHAAEPRGRVSAVSPPAEGGVSASLRQVQPLVEVRTPFQLSLDELDNVDRGAFDPDLSAVTEAAKRAGLVEDQAVFQGYPAAAISGIGPASPHPPIEISDDYGRYPQQVARAVATLRRQGIGGPYALALGPRCYTGVVETTEHGGYPLLDHMKLILGGPVLWAPGVDGGVVLSTRGGDYTFVSGQDFSIGYRGHSGDTVDLYIEESFTLLIEEPAAAVVLRYPS
jgi:uncharacterized linocin/CFP29 family protein